jgi:small subunit ribosomal protein S19e
MSLVDEVKKIKEVQAPEWAKFVKTGAHKERPPVQQDWWEIRAASVLMKVNKYGPVGTNRLAKLYGGRKNRGHKPERKYSASRNIIRTILQQLTAAGLIKDAEGDKKGKIVTKEGKELIKKNR